jgi:hypothetical protein
MSVLEDLGAALDQSIIVGSVPTSEYARGECKNLEQSSPRPPLFCNMCIFGQKRCCRLRTKLV